MGDKEGFEDVVIPEIKIRSCGGCKYYEHSMVKSGQHPIYSKNCTHPDSGHDVGMFNEGNLSYHPTMRVVETPKWCPFLKDHKDTKPKEDKYFLVYYTDEGNREDCSVFYSSLVLATDKEEAIDKYMKEVPTADRERLDAEKMKLIR